MQVCGEVSKELKLRVYEPKVVLYKELTRGGTASPNKFGGITKCPEWGILPYYNKNGFLFRKPFYFLTASEGIPLGNGKDPGLAGRSSVPHEAAVFCQAMEISSLWISVSRVSSLSSRLDFFIE
jgi:hypothetical protein